MGRSINPYAGGGCAGDFVVHMNERTPQMPVHFDSVYNPSSAAAVVTLVGTSGVLNQTQATLLRKNINAVINLNNEFYRLTVKQLTQLIYSTTQIDMNKADRVYINLDTNEWYYEHQENYPINQHVADTAAHVNEGERDFWNNKLNYEIGEEEKLILTRN